MGMFSFITDLFTPATELIDDLHYSGEEKAELKNVLAGIQAKTNAKFIDLELAVLNARKEMSIAESKSDHAIVYSWRPIVSLVLISLIVLDSFGVIRASQDLYTLATAFLGLTTAGRGIEKAARANKLGS